MIHVASRLVPPMLLGRGNAAEAGLDHGVECLAGKGQGTQYGAKEVSVGDVEEVEVEVVSRLAQPVLLREVALQLGVLQEMKVAISPRGKLENSLSEAQVTSPPPPPPFPSFWCLIIT